MLKKITDLSRNSFSHLQGSPCVKLFKGQSLLNPILKIRFAAGLIIIPVILALSCASSGNRKPLYEGFSGNTLTVLIIEFIPEEKNTEAALRPLLLEKLNQRAFIILASYVSININRSKVSAATDRLLNDIISSTLSQGRIVQFSFNEKGYCEAFAEYDMTGFFKVMNEINNQ